MAVVKRNSMSIAEVRGRIQTLRLVNRLEKHVLDGEEMAKSQVSAAIALLKKTIPDLQAVQISGDAENPLVVSRPPIELAREMMFLLSRVDEAQNAVDITPSVIQDEKGNDSNGQAQMGARGKQRIGKDPRRGNGHTNGQ